MDKPTTEKVIFAFIRLLLVHLISLEIMLLSAGNPRWIGAWTIFGLSAGYSLLMITIGMKLFPQTVIGRAESRFVHRWDKIALQLYITGLYSQYIIGGLSTRFSISEFHLRSYAVGVAFYMIALGITTWIFLTNPYAIGSSRIQNERNQRVISNGPYRLLRHPMYFTVIITSLSTALILCAPWALLSSLIVIGAFIYRCYREDAMLIAELDGYREYAQRVKYRMIPLVW